MVANAFCAVGVSVVVVIFISIQFVSFMKPSVRLQRVRTDGRTDRIRRTLARVIRSKFCVLLGYCGTAVFRGSLAATTTSAMSLAAGNY
jgi:hypothetical protein